MNDPERWIDGASDNAEILRLLKASKEAGPTIAEKAALGARLGVASGSVWLTPVIKAMLAGGGILASVVAYQALVPRDGSSSVESKAPGHVEAPRDKVDDKSALPTGPVREIPAGQIEPRENAVDLENIPEKPQQVPAASEKPPLKVSRGMPPVPSEARLLSQARHALETTPEHALALIKSHEQYYPNGVLSQERAVLKMKALQKLGQDQEAAATEKKFRAEHPESVHHVESAPAEKKGSK